MARTLGKKRLGRREGSAWVRVLSGLVVASVMTAGLVGPAVGATPQSDFSGPSDTPSAADGEDTPANADLDPAAPDEPTVSPREVRGAQANTGWSGSEYADAEHFDSHVYFDEDSGEYVELKSGITHHRETKVGAALRMLPFASSASASYPEIFPSVTTTFPSNGIVGVDGSLVLRIDIDIPDASQPGDVYTLKAPIPFAFTSAGWNREIKDASGKVFAVTESGEGTGGVPSNGSRTLRIILTEDVAQFVEIEGFIEVPLAAATKVSVLSYTVNIEAPDGAKLGPNRSVRTAASVAKTNDFVSGSGTTSLNRPTVTPAINVASAQMKDGLYARFSSGSADLTLAGCAGANVSVEGFRSDGFYEIRQIGRISDLPNVSCVVTDGGRTATITFSKAMALPTGFAGAVFRVLPGSFVGAGPNLPYPFSMATNWTNTNPPRPQTWSGTVRTGVPVGSGASYLSLTTAKSATFTTQHGDSKPTSGDVITYTITTAPGADNSRAVNDLVTTDSLPEGLEFISATNGGDYNPGTREIVWGPRILTSTGKFVDVVEAKIVSVPSAGSVTNKVTNAATSVCGAGDQISICEADVTTPVGAPGFDFVKHSQVTYADDDRGFDGAIAGDKITYWFTAENTGDTTLTTLKMDDDLLGLTDVECFSAGDTLAPGKSTECAKRYEYTITEADQEAGSVTNHATGTVPGLPPVTPETTDPTVSPGFDFVKHSQVTYADDDRGFDGAIAGDKITYWFTAENTGNVDLNELVIDDELLGLSNENCLADERVLKVGESAECSNRYEYTITEADQQAGSVTNHATGTVPGLPPITPETTDPTVNPGFEFDKYIAQIRDASGAVIDDGKVMAGYVIHFGFSAKNTGNVDIDTLTISDPLLGVTEVECLADGKSLMPSETVECEDHAAYQYKVTESDVEAGTVHNIATGSVPGLPDQEDETETPVLPTPLVPTLPNTGAGGTWLVVGAGALLLGSAVVALAAGNRGPHGRRKHAA